MSYFQYIPFHRSMKFQKQFFFSSYNSFFSMKSLTRIHKNIFFPLSALCSFYLDINYNFEITSNKIFLFIYTLVINLPFSHTQNFFPHNIIRKYIKPLSITHNKYNVWCSWFEYWVQYKLSAPKSAVIIRKEKNEKHLDNK